MANIYDAIERVKEPLAKQQIMMLSYGILKYCRRYGTNKEYVFTQISLQVNEIIETEKPQTIQQTLEHFVYHPDMVKMEQIP